MTLDDALIAATALAYGLTLITHNGDDFAWIPSLALFDPLNLLRTLQTGDISFAQFDVLW